MGRLVAIIAAVLVAVLLSSILIVNEGEKAIVSRFGKILKDEGVTRIYEPGLHIKLPMIDKIKFLDSRIQTMDGAADRFVTSEKKDLMVDSYVKWRIFDYEKYYLSTGGGIKATAESLLQRKINNDLRTEFGRRTIKEIVSGSRDELQQDALVNAAESAADLGIEVVDVRVKQINLPANVSSSIYQRMRAERTAVAKEHRAQGMEQSEIIRAKTDASVTIQIADAERKALEVKGEGDAQSAKIYADAYSKDAEFYSFLRSLEAYKASFADGSNVMILEPDSEFFKYMNSSQGK
ncbi:protein HflC [Shewanella hanedai]|jgi:membrane protease subunit HflC|uniref:Protein HflC n=1 Tax=Shewanella hanedai TaxID=25 RepID=A0A553JTJ4_SHEHA|nr:protease modulator HflC [Shewanella hanedai]TRY15785.1 protease modulator HflC [Shewanella hanedai]GGI70648.1 protein HflC [Shewanella hanedai]